MVFNSADPTPSSTSYMSLLRRFESRATTSDPAPPSNRPISRANTTPAATASSRTQTINTSNTRPSPAVSASTQKPTSTSTSTTNAPQTGQGSVSTSGAKRKAEEITKRGTTADASKNAPPKPTEPAKPPKKGSYAELLARAKTVNLKAPVGAIVNKPKAPAEKIQKEWQKKFQEERAAKTGDGRKPSKSPGLASGGEKSGTKPVAKKEPIGSGKSSGAPLDRKSTVPTGGASKSKASVSDAKSRVPDRGRDRSPPSRKPSRDDYPPRSRVSAAPKARPTARYVYREDSYDSDSDMEATGIDILEEEEVSAKKARLEDLEQERLEREAAERKARLLGKKVPGKR